MTLAEELQKALPGVLTREWDQLIQGAPWQGGAPELLVSPSSTEEVSQVLTWAGQEELGVLPLGSGRHLGQVAHFGPTWVRSLGWGEGGETGGCTAHQVRKRRI